MTLSRAAIEASEGEEIPLDWVVRDEVTSRPNGTTVTVSEVLLPRVETSSIIEYIERHLPHFRAVNPQVAVNNHVCEYREPRVVDSYTFRPSAQQAEVIGDVGLQINVAQAPLPEADQGIAVTSGVGNLVAIERGGVEKKEFGAYLFGQVDVPAIEDSSSPIAPYDATRSLQLNPKHPVVAVLLGFIGSKLEEVRGVLVEKEKEARRTEEARRLANEADQIAEILNEDFNDQLRKLREIRTATSVATGTVQAMHGEGSEAGEEEDAWVSGSDEPGVLETTGTHEGSGEPEGRSDPELPRTGTKDPEGEDLVSPAGGSGKRKRPKGGFSVEYRNLGEEEDRSRYDSSAMMILINLDHPVVSAALGGGGVETPGFRRLSYEIAFGEYAIALGYEMANFDPEIPADDLLYEVRTTLNRVARSSAALYR